MARGDHWWNEPPWWAWAVMAASLVAIIVMLPFALNRQPPEPDLSTGSARTPEPGGAPTPAAGTAGTSAPGTAPADEDVAQVLVIGDVDTAGFETGAIGWPAVLQERLTDVEITVATTGDAGYVTTEGPADATFPELIADADLDDVDVIVVFGSRYDASGIADQVDFAVNLSVGAIGQRAPDAELILIGPASPADPAPAGVRNNRDVIRAAAESGEAVFVDPLTDGWLADAPELVGPDGEHLIAEADVYLANRIAPLIQEALRA
ncbi:hypothetical protein [Trujillonella humicola]|uniref:hypothetical protein n=1 Tax=Trujillonella humicola TaxID=3383699 RepID=UPI0039060FE0